MFDRRYFVYMLQSTSRHALYIGFTNFLIGRVIEHRTRKHPDSFSAKYRTWRLVYFEEFGDSGAAYRRERQLKGWSRAKKESLIVKINPHWHDLIAEWEEKYGLEFRLDGPNRGQNCACRRKPKQKILRLRSLHPNNEHRVVGDPASPALEKTRGNPPPLRMLETGDS